MKRGYVKGPWKKVRALDSTFYIEEQDQHAVVATIHQLCGFEKANANLIIAAPDLLEALIQVTDELEVNYLSDMDKTGLSFKAGTAMVKRARKAVAKAMSKK